MPDVSLFSPTPATVLAGTPHSLPKLLYSRNEAAFVLGLSTRSIDYLIAGKRLNTIRVGKKVMLGHGELVRFSRKNHYDSITEPAVN